MASLLAIRLKVCGLKPSQDDGFLRAIKIHNTFLQRGSKTVSPMS
jgi:hypothetical protein